MTQRDLAHEQVEVDVLPRRRGDVLSLDLAGRSRFDHGLGFGARLLSPLMARPVTWRILDAAIGVVMLTIAIVLVRSAVL